MKLFWLLRPNTNDTVKQKNYGIIKTRKNCFNTNNIYEFLHSDWLRAVQFFSKTVENRVNSVQKEVKNQAFWLVNNQKLTDGKLNLLFSNQACALDGTIFPRLRVTRAFLLLNHLTFFYVYYWKVCKWFLSHNLE